MFQLNYSKYSIATFLILFTVISINIFINFDQWCGDPEINLIFAKNILKGHFLQFNLGEYSSGNTSVLYSSIIAIILKFLPLSYTAYSMKVIGFISAIFIGLQFYKHSNYVGYNQFNSLIISLFLLSPTFYWFHALGGMENIIFAAIVAVTIRLIFEGKLQNSKTSIYLLTLIWPIVFFLRPEVVFLIFTLMIISLFHKNKNLFFSSVLSLLIIFVSKLYIEYLISAPLHGAGNARLALSKLKSIEMDLYFLKIYLNYKSLFIVYAIFPSLFILFLTKPKIKNQVNLNIIFFGMVILPFFLYLFLPYLFFP